MEKEGVIKFHLNHQFTDPFINIDFNEMNTWRTLMHRLGIIGQDPDRYKGYGFGNISQKDPENENQFIVSGTQTGQKKSLHKKDYCLILEANPDTNSIKSEGDSKPSSETLTHAAIYLQSPDIKCIIHGHCPEIWEKTNKLKIPHTANNVEYGTPAMANAVSQLFQDIEGLPQKSILTMLGHKDGVFTFGSSMQQAGLVMIKYLALALTVDQS